MMRRALFLPLYLLALRLNVWTAPTGPIRAMRERHRQRALRDLDEMIAEARRG